jgi:hypothetical protein
MGVAKILRSHRIPPDPRRSQPTWRQFLRQHAAQMLATDFFTVETAWLQRLHVLFFIEIASRKVHLGGITASPTGEWVAQQGHTLRASCCGAVQPGAHGSRCWLCATSSASSNAKSRPGYPSAGTQSLRPGRTKLNSCPALTPAGTNFGNGLRGLTRFDRTALPAGRRGSVTT